MTPSRPGVALDVQISSNTTPFRKLNLQQSPSQRVQSHRKIVPLSDYERIIRRTPFNNPHQFCFYNLLQLIVAETSNSSLIAWPWTAFIFRVSIAVRQHCVSVIVCCRNLFIDRVPSSCSALFSKHAAVDRAVGRDFTC